MAILSFKHKGLKKLWEENDASKVPAEHVKKLRNMLTYLDSSTSLNDLSAFPNWRFHEHIGNEKGLYSWTVSGNWRLLFRFENGDAEALDYRDPH